MISYFNTFAMAPRWQGLRARAMFRYGWVHIWVASVAPWRRFWGVDEAVAQGGIFRVSGQGDSFDVVRRLAAALLGLGQ